MQDNIQKFSQMIDKLDASISTYNTPEDSVEFRAKQTQMMDYVYEKFKEYNMQFKSFQKEVSANKDDKEGKLIANDMQQKFN